MRNEAVVFSLRATDCDRLGLFTLYAGVTPDSHQSKFANPECEAMMEIICIATICSKCERLSLNW